LNALQRSTEAQAMVDSGLDVAERVPDVVMNQLPGVLRAAVSVQVGDPMAYELVSKLMQTAERLDERFLSDEQHTLWGLALLQRGDVAAAVETLRATTTQAKNLGPAAAANVALAAALVANGEAKAALEVCDETDLLAVTFVDRYRLDLARGFAHHRLGDEAAGRAAFDRAAAIVNATHSPLDQFIVRLARAARDRQGPPDEQRSPGWETAFALMAGTPG
jgi:hypothetical protein